jgi:hypothetical protein
LATLDAPQRRLLAGRRPREIAPGPPPAPVTTSRATVVDAAPFASAADAERWLDEVDVAGHAAAGIAVLERVIALHRLAVADTRVPAPTLALAVAARVGIGEGEEVADGRWRRALELPVSRTPRRRDAALRPAERLAALLGGRDAALACEVLALRAREDVDAGRRREAAFQLDAALKAATAELEPWRGRNDLGARIDELAALRGDVTAIASAARGGGIDDEQAALVARALGRLEAALRARTALGFDG